MMFAFNRMTSGPEMEWSRPSMIAWLALVLALSVIEVFWLKGGLASRGVLKFLPQKAQRRKESPDETRQCFASLREKSSSSYATSFFYAPNTATQ